MYLHRIRGRATINLRENKLKASIHISTFLHPGRKWRYKALEDVKAVKYVAENAYDDFYR